jgi:hypothetical protein
MIHAKAHLGNWNIPVLVPQHPPKLTVLFVVVVDAMLVWLSPSAAFDPSGCRALSHSSRLTAA